MAIRKQISLLKIHVVYDNGLPRYFLQGVGTVTATLSDESHTRGGII